MRQEEINHGQAYVQGPQLDRAQPPNSSNYQRYPASQVGSDLNGTGSDNGMYLSRTRARGSATAERSKVSVQGLGRAPTRSWSTQANVDPRKALLAELRRLDAEERSKRRAASASEPIQQSQQSQQARADELMSNMGGWMCGRFAELKSSRACQSLEGPRQ